MYIGNTQALIGGDINRMDMINEIFLAFITFFTVSFTDFTQNEESKVLAAWSFNILILLMLVINIVPILIESFRLS